MNPLFYRVFRQPDCITDLLSDSSISDEDTILLIDVLLSEFITPAKRLLITSDDGEKYYSPQIASGIEVPDFLVSLLTDDFPSLQTSFDHEKLIKAFEKFDVKDTTIQARKLFFQAWMAERACIIIQYIINYVMGDNEKKSGKIRNKLLKLGQLNHIGLTSFQQSLIHLLG